LDAATANIRSEAQLAEILGKLEAQMREAAKKFEFEKAAQLPGPDTVVEAAGFDGDVRERERGGGWRRMKVGRRERENSVEPI